MPRSFLVKKYFTSKKPNYSELESQNDRAVLLERPPLAELLPGGNANTTSLVWNLDLLPDLLTPVGPLDLSPPASSSGEEEDEGCTSDPTSPEAAAQYQCPLCSKSYGGPSALSRHRLSHHPPAARPAFCCKHCPKEYSSLGALKMHIRSHTLPCVCPTCGKAFSRAWLLRGHIRTHTGERPFSCPHCERAFADRSNLRAHLQTHVQVKRHHCSACPRSFSRVSLLHKHNLAGCSPAPV
ncbi:hypothetical protein AAFF_G00145030 [Aldrovandia affinis]|uniref:C2H2-type domain-containing protein n=1 Tax=Aldrovandia affinis TaxID=143900 RepID=A0AAD7T2J5_9TELE|nr:hypothetical protein AAFF_G00145030 [Aldrovandia affinis]